MLSKILSHSAILLLAAKLAAAQTSSACNPFKGDKCPDNPAFPDEVTIDFTAGENEYFTIADGTTLEYDDDKGAVFTINKETDAPTITSTKYLFFGTVEAVIMAAPGTGVVTSFVLESDDLDEVDWEWLGGDTKQVQTNYFGKGNTTTYDRGGFSVVSTPQTEFHTYTLDWSPEALVWSIDGTVTRTLKYADANGGESFPQTPMQVKVGTWDAGSSTSPEGTVTWAGGLTPFGDGNGPYKAYYKSIKITNKSNGVSGATSYTYGDSTGSYKSIVVNTDGDSDSSSSSSSASSDSKTSTKATDSATSTGSASGAATATGTSTGSESAASSLVTSATGTAKATSTKSSTSSSASGSASGSVVSTNGVSKSAVNVFGGAAAAFLAVAALL